MSTTSLIEQLEDYLVRIFPPNLCRVKVKKDKISIQFRLHENQGNPLAIVFKDEETIMYELGNEIKELYVIPIEYGCFPIERRVMTYYMDGMLERKK